MRHNTNVKCCITAPSCFSPQQNRLELRKQRVTIVNKKLALELKLDSLVVFLEGPSHGSQNTVHLVAVISYVRTGSAGLLHNRPACISCDMIL